MIDSSFEDKTHWSEEKEAIKTNKPLKLVLFLLKVLPSALVHVVCYPVAFFYFLFSAYGRKFSLGYQKQLREFTNGRVPPKINAFKQILNFSLCIMEKMEGWLGKVSFDRIRLQNDDMGDMVERLKRGESSILMVSHSGNMELMRSMQDYITGLCGRKVPVCIIMDMKMSENFAQTLKEINPKYSSNVIDASDFGPDSVIQLQEQIEQGALIVAAGDRTSINNRDKVIKKNFLGREAKFPYGVFLIPALVKLPVYFMFGMRSKMSVFNPQYNIYIEKSKVDFNCKRTEREKCIEECCGEFVEKLQKFCIMYPYQWYNFFNFWG